MKYTVRRYTIVPEKPFKTTGEAVQYIQKKHPELDRETIEKYLNPSIKEHDTDKSGDIPEKTSESKKGTSKISPRSNEERSAGEDQPR